MSVDDKKRSGWSTYKASLFSQEPGIALPELTSGMRETILDPMEIEPQPKAIAIVDDDFGVRQALERILAIAGFRVQAFSSAEDFLTSVTTGDIGCAVIDVNLGVSNGLDLGSNPDVLAANLPLIFISGRADDSARARALALGCVQFLRKPFMPIELLDAIHRATQHLSPVP